MRSDGGAAAATAVASGGMNYKVGQRVEGRFWSREGEEPMAQLDFWQATVDAVNDDGTVNLLYDADKKCPQAETYLEHVELW